MTAIMDESIAQIPITQWVGQWWVSNCRPRYEKQFVREMQAEGIQAYCPIERVRCRNRDTGRVENRERVLWDQYAFFCGDSSSRYSAATSRCVSSIIEIKNQSRFIRQLSSVWEALEYDPFARRYGLAIGQRCVVRQNHPLRGKEGILIEADESKARFVLEMDMLGAGVVLEIDPAFLEVASRATDDGKVTKWH